jgi:endonuclease/exonuclease/phosphatase family metal-dependent hydrolase
MRRPHRLVPLVVIALLAVAAIAASAATARESESGGLSEYSLLQMNLCLSGLAGCYAGTEYPAVVGEAIEKMLATQPDAVTLNEACSGDVERIARETGYDYRFDTVIYRGAPLPCRNPGDRGVFGIAVLSSDVIGGAESAPYEAQLGPEERRLLCVRTGDDVRVCTSHLSVSGSPGEVATNDAQCEELSEALAGDDRRQATLFGGDVNRLSSCSPRGAWTERDEEAVQAPGIQHVYGTRPGFVRPRDEVLPMNYSDHDALLMRALRLG